MTISIRRTSRQTLSAIQLVPLALLLAVVAALSACTKVQTQGAGPGLPRVTAAAAVARDVTEWDEFTGRLEAVQSVAVRPRVSGLVSDVSFEEGGLVHQGDVLF